MKQYYVYLLASTSERLYIGVNSYLVTRVYEHKNKLIDGFTKKYNINKLVYYEVHQDIHEAIAKEKRMKKRLRQYKVNIITEFNPTWQDLYSQICE